MRKTSLEEGMPRTDMAINQVLGSFLAESHALRQCHVAGHRGQMSRSIVDTFSPCCAADSPGSDRASAYLPTLNARRPPTMRWALVTLRSTRATNLEPIHR